MNSISDTYRSIAAPAQGIYKELGSKFLAFAYPVETEEEAKAILEKVRKDYFDARHHCYAWRIGLTGEPYRMNDDGEPSSTAGRPIHGQLLSNGLSDILVVVVRYFGGTMKVLKDMGITPLRQDFDLRCSLSVRVRLSQIEEFRKQLAFCQIK